MEKKKLLFVMPSLSAGGGEKSLINLLHEIDYELFSVDLALFSNKGIFLKQLPKEVNIIQVPGMYNIFTLEVFKSAITFLKQREFRQAWNRMIFSAINRLCINKSVAEQVSWKYVSGSIGQLESQYDAAIGFLEKSSIYFVVDKVNARKKIGWIHTNYTNSGLDPKLDYKYLNHLDYTATVSEECADSLKRNFPSLKDKVRIIYNIISPSNIKSLADIEFNNEVHLYTDSYTTLITVARLSYEKGIDMATEACKILVDRGYNIKWFVIGEGQERKNIESLIQQKGIEQNFILLGLKDNPYKYMKKADIYIQPSRYEGKSIAIDEAKILSKPIVVTNFETVKDQICHGENGIIAKSCPEGISQAIEELINNHKYREKLQRNLDKEIVGTVEEIEKLYQLI